MKRRTAIAAISTLAALSLVLGLWGVRQYNRAEDYAIAVEANYQHAFSELVTSLTEMDSALQKSLYATSPSMTCALCTEVFGKAMTAQMTLGVLPFTTQELERTAGFISRVGDYAYMLSRSAAAGEGYTAEQKENLAALSDTAAILAQNMTQLQTDMSDGLLTMDELTEAEARQDRAEESLPETLSGGMRLIEQEFPEVPALIYDGPFSQHLDTAKPKLLENLREFSESEARLAAGAFMGEARKGIKSRGRTEGKLPTWDFAAKCGDGEMNLSVSVQGGKPVQLLCSRSIDESRISPEQAQAAAKAYLETHGFDSMEMNYHIIRDGVMTVNFAYSQDGVLCYADLVKVGVALDDGEIVSLETRGYLMNHSRRQLPQVQVTAEAAAEHIPPELKLLQSRLCLIPRPGGEEVLCHEFICETERQQKYILYVDAVSGQQEKILILLEDESGALTL